MSALGERPMRLATVPVVLCVLAYTAYRASNLFPTGPYDPGFSPAGQAFGIAVIATLGAVQLWLALRRPSRARAGLLLAVQVLLTYGPLAVFGSIWDPPAAYVVAAVLFTFPGWYAWAVVAVAVLGDLAVRAHFEPGVVDADGDLVLMRAAYAIVAAVTNGALLYGVAHLSALIRDLAAARDAGAALEVARERLRVARRLQDAVGGRLVTIIATLRRLPPAGAAGTTGTPNEVGDRARDVAAAAREALAQVRAVADDYRDRSLAGEVEAARTVLTAAGVEVAVGPVPSLPEPVDELLAAILRRTVVDALRGTPPRACRIDLDRSAFLRVSFIGGAPGTLTPGDLADEVAELGGRLHAGPDGIEVRIPVPARRPGSARRPAAAAPWLAWGIMAVLEIDLLIATISRVAGTWDSYYGPTPAGQVILILALIVPLSLLQLHHVRPRQGKAPPLWRWTLAVQIALVCLITLFGSPIAPGPQYAGPVAGVVLFHLRRPWSWLIAGTLVVTTALYWLRAYGADITAGLAETVWLTALTSSFSLLAMVGVAALCRLPVAAEQVNAARRELARLAVLHERLRIARDTHDLLGFQLSAIALKADVAGRQAGTDPDAARTRLAEIGQAAEEALGSVRSITAEPTRLSFADEVESARSVLAAAGVQTVVDLQANPAPAAEVPLAIVLREAVTNVVRHSRASTCEIETSNGTGGIRLRVTNDGVHPDQPSGTAGNGLANLLARAREAGGQLDFHREGDRFTLVVQL